MKIQYRDGRFYRDKVKINAATIRDYILAEKPLEVTDDKGYDVTNEVLLRIALGVKLPEPVADTLIKVIDSDIILRIIECGGCENYLRREH